VSDLSDHRQSTYDVTLHDLEPYRFRPGELQLDSTVLSSQGIDHVTRAEQCGRRELNWQV
jgi:hypothetical protein